MEGLITIFAGFVFTLFIPPKAGDGRPLISGGRWSYFNKRESQIIRDRVLLDDPLKAQGHIKITGRDIWDTVRQANVIQHFFISLISMSAYQGLNHYTPSMIKSFGFGSVNANALASVPVYCSMVWTLALAYLAYVWPYELRLVDKQVLTDQGSTGPSWSIRAVMHYLECHFVRVSTGKSMGFFSVA